MYSGCALINFFPAGTSKKSKMLYIIHSSGLLKTLRKIISYLLSKIINDEGVCRTAPATQVLSNIYLGAGIFLVKVWGGCLFIRRMDSCYKCVAVGIVVLCWKNCANAVIVQVWRESFNVRKSRLVLQLFSGGDSCSP